MWSDLLDDKGRKRGSIFYKAAFYDRKAHLSLDRRYHSTPEYLNDDLTPFNWGSGKEPAKRWFCVKDSANGETVFHTEPWPDRDYTTGEQRGAQAVAWLKEHFPQHDDVLAYW